MCGRWRVLLLCGCVSQVYWKWLRPGTLWISLKRLPRTLHGNQITSFGCITSFCSHLQFRWNLNISTGTSVRARWPRPQWLRPSRREAASDWSPRKSSAQRGGLLLLHHRRHAGEFKEKALLFLSFQLNWIQSCLSLLKLRFLSLCVCWLALSHEFPYLNLVYFHFYSSAVSMEMHICLVGEMQRPTECVGTVNIDHNTIYWVRYTGQ